MLKPNETWSWFYDKASDNLMLDVGMEMIFRTNLSKKVLINSAFENTPFSIDDASDYELFFECISDLPISEPRKVEVALNCVAVKHFHKPTLPKSWFFDTQNSVYTPEEGEIISLKNKRGEGHFIVIENYTCASMCLFIDMDTFALDSTQAMSFCEPIKVMHDRMDKLKVISASYYALVG